MRVLIDGKWRDGFLDYAPEPNEYVIDVFAWKNLERLTGVYIVRPNSLWTVWNYLWDIGPRQTIHKILSRSQERYRNEKYVACGIGCLRSVPQGSAMPIGQWVVFLAPCHPQLVQRIVLPSLLLKPVDVANLTFIRRRYVVCDANPTEVPQPQRWWRPIRGWSPQSGIDHSPKVCRRLLDQALETLCHTNWERALQLVCDSPTCEVVTRVQAVRPTDARKKSAVLFGYGNYAKNIVLPNVREHLDVRSFHEIDPLQIPLRRSNRVAWDTGAKLDEVENYDVLLIAGFHHSHTPLAIQALERGACAIVEKPIAVDKSQVTALVNAMSRSSGKIFCCFHKRYTAFNELALHDLNLQPGEPVSYHCIVYEVPMPPLHWYRWPNSKSRLIIDGCHWIDHFLYLNKYSEATDCDLTVAPDRSALNCSITLANGAYFTMVMTHSGSERIGPRDYIELRSNARTVSILDESKYVAESKQRILHKKWINRMRSYEEMYRKISRQVNLGREGDSVASVTGAAELGLHLEELLHNIVGRARAA